MNYQQRINSDQTITYKMKMNAKRILLKINRERELQTTWTSHAYASKQRMTLILLYFVGF